MELFDTSFNRYENTQKILAVIMQEISREFGLTGADGIGDIQPGGSLAIALDEDGQILGFPVAVPAGRLAQALRRLAGSLLKKVTYVTDTEVPEILRQGLGIPTKRIPVGGRIAAGGSVSLIGKAKVSDSNVVRMEWEGDGAEIDPLTADLLVHLMAVVGTMVNYGSKGELIRKAGDPVAGLLKQYPGLRVILDRENLKFDRKNGTPAFVFAVKALQEKLTRQTLEAAA